MLVLEQAGDGAEIANANGSWSYCCFDVANSIAIGRVCAH